MLKTGTKVISIWNGNCGAKARILAYRAGSYILDFKIEANVPENYTSPVLTGLGYNDATCMLFSSGNFKLDLTKTNSLSIYIINEKKI